MNPIRAQLHFWLSGLLMAVVGIILVRGLAPQWEKPFRLYLTLAGQLLALGGLLVICLGIRRRIQTADKLD